MTVFQGAGEHLGACLSATCDLKQLVLILTVSAGGGLPLAHCLGAGNTNDDQTHIATLGRAIICALTHHSDFLYLADSTASMSA